MSLVLLLTQQMSLYLVMVYLISKTPLFQFFSEAATRLPHKIFIYLTFSSFCVMATYFGEHTNDALANTRAMGAVLGGLLGGPVTGFLVGLTGGLHRYSMGDLPILPARSPPLLRDYLQELSVYTSENRAKVSLSMLLCWCV